MAADRKKLESAIERVKKIEDAAKAAAEALRKQEEIVPIARKVQPTPKK